MRRSDREVTDIQEIRALIDECKVIRLAMIDGDKPYVVPLNFGYTYENGAFTFYCHSAKEGKKLDVIRKNASVAFEMDCQNALQHGETACTHSYYYASVLGEGKAEILEGDEKCKGLSALMLHMAGRNDVFTAEMVDKVAVIAIRVDALTAKKRPQPKQ